MVLQHIAAAFSLITVLCFTFLIPVLTVWFKNAEELPKLLGLSFIPVFMLSAASMAVGQAELSVAFAQITEPLLLLLFAVVIITGGSGKHNFPARSTLVLTPVVLTTVMVFSVPVRNLLTEPLVCLFIMTAAALAIMHKLQKAAADLTLLFPAVLALLASVFSQYYLHSGVFALLSPLLKAGGYLIILLYFHRVFMLAMYVKTVENEKRLNEIERSIEHEVKRRILNIEKSNKRLIDISKTDALSQLLNKSAILESIENLITGARKSEFSILMFDIDNFKNINDTYGHVVGDKCIKSLAAAARSSLRGVDTIGRYGGDEFIIVLPGASAKNAITIAERFRKRIESMDSPSYTISIGIAVYPTDGSDVKTLIEAADEGLYISKQKGKNAVSYRNFY